MKAILVVVSPDGQTKDVPFEVARITVGRKAGNDLHFERAEISGSHAVFLKEQDRYFVMDVGSMNGTLLNSAQLVAQQKYALEDGDVISIAPYLITFRAGNDLLDTFKEDLSQAQRVGFGTLVEQIPRTGTDEHKKIELPFGKTVAKPDSTPLPPIATPLPEVKQAAPVPPPIPQPPSGPRKNEDLTATARPDHAGKPARKGADYIWLGLGALILLAALAVIALILMA